jgi:class 3 adenylate cyclase
MLTNGTRPQGARKPLLIATVSGAAMPWHWDDLTEYEAFTEQYKMVVVDNRDLIVVLARTLEPQVILIDLDFPDGAIATLEALRSQWQTQALPVIACGSNAEAADRAAVFAAGFNDYWLKPILPLELMARLDMHCALRTLQLRPELIASRAATRTHNALPLLSELQKTLRRQAEKLQEQNARLEQEVCDRRQAEAALRTEQSKYERLLLNILPQAIVDRLKSYEGSIAERFDEATILFADIVDFTPLSARMSALELVDLLNQIFSEFDLLADRFGLEKIKTIGDAYMAVGGVPVPRADHAEAVIEMAIAMRAEIRRFRRDTGRPLRLRIGINTGAVVAGVIGIKKFSYDLWGDAVNIASRMESQGLPGKIQVTEATYRQLSDRYHFERWANLNVKGRGRMTTYLLVGRKGEAATDID